MRSKWANRIITKVILSFQSNALFADKPAKNKKNMNDDAWQKVYFLKLICEKQKN